MKLNDEIKFGIFAIITIALIIYGLQYMSGSKFFGAPLTLYAKYENVEGLIRGNPILINGLQVGRVTALRLNMTEGYATARLEFDEKLDIPSNSEAMIYSVDLLGSKGIQIWVPDSIQPAPNMLQDQDSIRGTVDKGIFAAAEDLVTSQGANILLQVGQLAVKLNDIVAKTQQLLEDQDNSQSLRAILENIRFTTRNLTSITGEVDTMAQSIRQSLGKVVSIIDNVESNNENVTGIMSNVRSTTDSLVAASAEIKKLMSDASSAVNYFESIISKLDTTSGTVGKLLNDTQLYDSLTVSIENINALLRQVQAHPNQFFDDIKLYLIERKPPKQKSPR